MKQSFFLLSILLIVGCSSSKDVEEHKDTRNCGVWQKQDKLEVALICDPYVNEWRQGYCVREPGTPVTMECF